eukprot:NODE_10686_length_1335_cov_6.019868.p1 GENE.NODE_10686_length_1335_cov_6.019868~~NODE_10686_length_1335_cov_6.019868.p1  ORF type:complete len:389 (+),score=104.33 NODE_10686_length_1335_cov_6.019868:83-1249(+)
MSLHEVADPFLGQPPPSRTIDVEHDPFMTKAHGNVPIRPVPGAQQMVNLAAASGSSESGRRSERSRGSSRRHKDAGGWTLKPSALLAPGESESGRWALQLLIFLPWLVFVVVLILLVCFRNYSPSLAIFMLTAIILVAAAFVVIGGVGKGQLTYPVLGIGILCIIAAIVSMVIGSTLWTNYARQYWYTTSGPVYDALKPTMLGAAYADAAVVDFLDTSAGNRTLAGTAVDHMQSAGYRDGDIYCAAPVLNGEAAKSSLQRVQFWAIGINCCMNTGYFMCDDSRSYMGGKGVVMLDQGMPCAGCNTEKFHAAVRKAEQTFGVVSAPGALYVRWVSDPKTVSSSLWRKAVGWSIFASVFAFLLFCVMGACVHHNGKHSSHPDKLKPPLPS